MKKIFYINALLASAALTSCVEDEGNYTLVPLNEVTIDGIESSYEKLSYVDRLEITPDVTGTINGDNLSDYEYEWHICSGTMGDEIHSHKFVSNEKDLDWPLEVTPGSYVLYFTVKEKSTGIETTTSTTVNVKSSFSKGFLLLGGIDGTQDIGLDMVTMAPDRDTVLVEGAFDDLYKGKTGPKKLYYSGSNYAAYMYLMSDDETWDVSIKDDNIFAPVQTFTQQGYVECEYDVKRPIRAIDVFPQGAFSYNTTLSTRARFFMAEDVILGGSSMVAPYYFANPYNRYGTTLNDKLFNFYPYIFFKYSGYWNAYGPAGFIYDSDNDRFVAMSFYTYKSDPIADSSGDPWKFDCKSEGRKLVYGESGYESGLSYMVMKDEEGKYYIYNVEFPRTGKRLYNVDTAVATDFDKASIYAFSYARRTVLYAVGNTLYHYDYTTNKAQKFELDGEITYLREEYLSNRNVNEFIIATWNSSANKGKVRKYNVDEVADDLSIELRDNEEWETRLKIKDIAWFSK